MSVYEEVRAARASAQAKHGPNGIEGIRAADHGWLAILTEEVGEVAHELTYDATGDLRAELVQVAAVATAWVDAIDRDAGRVNALGHRVCEGCGEEVVWCLCRAVAKGSAS